MNSLLKILGVALIMSNTVMAQEYSPIEWCDVELETIILDIADVKEDAIIVHEQKLEVGKDKVSFQKFQIEGCDYQREDLNISKYSTWFRRSYINGKYYEVDFKQKKGNCIVKIKSLMDDYSYGNEKLITVPVQEGDEMRFTLVGVNDKEALLYGVGVSSSRKRVVQVSVVDMDRLSANDTERTELDVLINESKLYRVHVDRENKSVELAYTLKGEEFDSLFISSVANGLESKVEFGSFVRSGIINVNWLDRDLLMKNEIVKYSNEIKTLDLEMIQILYSTKNADEPVAFINYDKNGERLDEIRIDLKSLLRGRTAREKERGEISIRNGRLPTFFDAEPKRYDHHMGEYFITYSMDGYNQSYNLYSVCFDQSGRFKWGKQMDYQLFNNWGNAYSGIVSHVNSDGNYVLIFNDHKRNYFENGEYNESGVEIKKDFENVPAYILFDSNTGEYERKLVPNCEVEDRIMSNYNFYMNGNHYLFILNDVSGVPAKIGILK